MLTARTQLCTPCSVGKPLEINLAAAGAGVREWVAVRVAMVMLAADVALQDWLFIYIEPQYHTTSTSDRCAKLHRPKGNRTRRRLVMSMKASTSVASSTQPATSRQLILRRRSLLPAAAPCTVATSVAPQVGRQPS